MADTKPTEDEKVIEEEPREAKADMKAEIYFFPNDGRLFSCEAASREEAEKKNDAYLKATKKETI